MGLPSVLDRHTHQLDTTRLLNTVHRLMQLHLSHLRSIEELRNRWTHRTPGGREWRKADMEGGEGERRGEGGWGREEGTTVLTLLSWCDPPAHVHGSGWQVMAHLTDSQNFICWGCGEMGWRMKLSPCLRWRERGCRMVCCKIVSWSCCSVPELTCFLAITTFGAFLNQNKAQFDC